MAKRKKDKTHGKQHKQLSLFDLMGEEYTESNETTIVRHESTTVFTLGNHESVGSRTANTANGSRQIQGEDTTRPQQTVSDLSGGLSSESASNREKGQDGRRNDVGMDKETTTLHNYYSTRVARRLNAKEKCEYNLIALRLLAQLEAEGRVPTQNEQEQLAQYSGWGGLPHIFNELDNSYAKERSELKELLSVNEYEQARSSVLTSFYTPYEIIDNIYEILQQFGFQQGKILEPSMGIGGFFSRLPYDMQESSLFGVELDEVSGKIARYLYPHANVDIQGLETTKLPNEYFDVAITNVPFGNYKVHDIEWNQKNYNIHNYFFMKSMQKVRKGGIVAFITTTETMDGTSSILQDLHKEAKLLGAIRLPASTFLLNGANTEVVSDIIFLQKLEEHEMSTDYFWLDKERLEHRYYNRYFYEHSQMVLGEMYEKTNQYGKPEITVKGDASKLSQRIQWVKDFFPRDVYHEQEVDKQMQQYTLLPQHMKYKINEHFIEDDIVYRRMEDSIEKVEESENNLNRLKGLIGLATKANEHIQLQVDDCSEEVFQQSLREFNVLYERFVKRYGRITSRTHEKLYQRDPNKYLLNSLERVNTKTKEVITSDFFYKRTIKAKEEIKSVDTIEDALSLSLNQKGVLDFSYMSYLYGKSEEQVREELLTAGKVYYNPFVQEYELDEVYLSGNVRQKLKEIKEYNEQAGGYENNISALEGVVPEWLEASDIKAQLGAPWIPREYIKEFGCTIFDFEPSSATYSNYQRFDAEYSELEGAWIVHAWSESWNKRITEEWGVAKDDKIDIKYSQPKYTGFQLFDDTLNSKVPVIYDYWDDVDSDKRKSRVNPVRTAVARDLQERLMNQFEEWVYEDAERRERIEEIYNHRFNSVRNREYNGSFLRFPEMSTTLQLEPYQQNAVARIMFDKNVLLSQVVGAGKTFEMVSAGMEMKRLKLRNKILYVVPNHLVAQWGSDFKKLYPQANILVATKKDFEKEKRNLFYHQIATSDIDAIIMAHSSFKLIPMSSEYQQKHIHKEIATLSEAIEYLRYQDDINYNRKNTKQVKTLERTKKSLEANIKKLVDVTRDDGLTFDQLGIDYIMVDEAHEFKNLYLYSQMRNVAGVPQVKSEKASDMFLKTQFIQEQGGGVCFATGTPISNTMAELYTMQRYLQLEDLEQAGIRCFDGWAKTFGKVINSFEISVDGSGFQTRQRFNKFFNVAELMTMFRGVAEILTAPMLTKHLEESLLGRTNAIPPKHIGGSPKVISLEPSSELEEYIANVVERTEAIHSRSVSPNEDNMLKVTTDSKKASIDLRLVDEDFGAITNTKLDYVKDEIARIYEEYNDDHATQLVFCDSSTPKENQFNVYHELRSGLVDRGIPKEEIAFIHDAKTELKKSALFEQMNRGDVRVLIGSTAKLGAGTNVQERLIAIHHVDVPWRASDVEQRNGRGFRQGNMYKEIYEIRYVTKKSFDAYSWQMIETKSTYMNQLLEGSSETREIAEDNSAILSYAEVKAIASGNPLIKEKLEVDTQLQKLETLKQQFQKRKYNAEKELTHIPNVIERQQKLVDMIAKDVTTAKENAYEEKDIEQRFQIIIDGRTFHVMKEAGEFMNERVQTFSKIGGQSETVGHFCGFDFGVIYEQGDGWKLSILGQEKIYKLDNLHIIGRVNFVRMLKAIASIPHDYEVEKRYLQTYQKNQQELLSVKEKEFPQAEELSELRIRKREIDQQLDVRLQDDNVSLDANEEEYEENLEQHQLS